jgi:outer membrane receptor protein involved in Fe transport
MTASTVPAFAQDGDKVEKVTVTGTRLKKRDYNTTSPVTTVGSQTFEMTNTNSVERLLNELPQLVPGNTFTSNNSGGEDFATIDLRGLGANRTLVLVNGNRLPASSTTGVVDINTIPAGLVDRVEVVTGGASAVYGSDAMSGVVNFILKKDYEGMTLTASAGQAEHGYAEERNVQALIGGNFAGGNGNITMFAEYFSREGLLQSAQDFSRRSGSYCYSYATGSYSVIDTNAEAIACRRPVVGPATGFVSAGGSGTPPWGWIANNGANPFTNLHLVPSLAARFAGANTDCNPITPGVNVTTGNISFNDLGQVTPRFNGGECGVPDRAGGSSRYNFAPDNYIILPAERYNVSAFGHYDIEKDLTLNFGAIYSDTFQRVQLAPTPATGIQVVYTKALQNYLTAFHPDLKAALDTRPNPFANFTMDRRTTELGTRNGLSENSSLSLFASLEGKISDSWSYEISTSFADVDFVSKLENSANRTAMAQGLAGCFSRAPGLDGILGNGDDVDVPLGPMALPGCVQIDLFGANSLNRGPDGIFGTFDDNQGVNFVSVDTWQRTSIEEAIVSAFLSGDLWDITGAGPIAFVGGGEMRYSKASFEVDNEQKSGNIAGFNALQNQNGSIDVWEGYTEISVPLVKDMPFFHYLGVEGGYRISDYSNAGIVHTYKYGGEWSPFEFLKFRGIYNKASRAPSVFEGFQNGDQGFATYTDPCRDNNADGLPDVAGVTLAECTTPGVILNGFVPVGLYTLVPPSFQANNTQVQAFSFGNPNLKPETAETTTYGLVLQTGDDWFGIGNLRGSIDHYQIEIADVIAGFGAQFFLNDCYVNNNPASCARIVRDSVSGQVFSVNTTVANQASFATEGYDIQIDYRLNLEDIGLAGVLSINELYSIIESYQFNGNEFAGTTSASIGGAIFDWKSVLTVNYGIDDWTFMTRWSYVPALPSNQFTGGAVIPVSPAASYVTMAVRYSPVDWLAMTLTVQNVTDEDTPQTLDGLFSQGNTDPQVYDVDGRSWALSVRTKF